MPRAGSTAARPSCVNRVPCGDVSTTVSGCPALGLDRVERPKDRLRLQHHPRPAAVRHVVHDAMAIGREVAQVVHLDRRACRARSRGRRSRPPSACSIIAGKIVTMSNRIVRRAAVAARLGRPFSSSSPSGGSITIRFAAGSIVVQIAAAERNQHLAARRRRRPGGCRPACPSTSVDRRRPARPSRRLDRGSRSDRAGRTCRPAAAPADRPAPAARAPPAPRRRSSSRCRAVPMTGRSR